ncbi:MAG TPA: hypothetical protein VLF79_02510 [Candidatus Saccharimonadales bacterium]|nr:hypothetical protein [Candidatus Saccharimonadales bacterium]
MSKNKLSKRQLASIPAAIAVAGSNPGAALAETAPDGSSHRSVRPQEQQLGHKIIGLAKDVESIGKNKITFKRNKYGNLVGKLVVTQEIQPTVQNNNTTGLYKFTVNAPAKNHHLDLNNTSSVHIEGQAHYNNSDSSGGYSVDYTYVHQPDGWQLGEDVSASGLSNSDGHGLGWSREIHIPISRLNPRTASHLLTDGKAVVTAAAEGNSINETNLQ